MTTTTHNKKVTKIENKILDTTSPIRNTHYDTKVKQVKGKKSDHDRYITTVKLNKFFGKIFDVKIK